MSPTRLELLPCLARPTGLVSIQGSGLGKKRIRGLLSPLVLLWPKHSRSRPVLLACPGLQGGIRQGRPCKSVPCR